MFWFLLLGLVSAALAAVCPEGDRYHCCYKYDSFGDGEWVTSGTEWTLDGVRYRCTDGTTDNLGKLDSHTSVVHPVTEDDCPDSEKPTQFRCCWKDKRYVRENSEWIRGNTLYQCKYGREEEIGCAWNGVKAESYDQDGYRFSCERDARGYTFKISHCIDKSGVAHREGEKFLETYGDKFWFLCKRTTTTQLSKVSSGCVTASGAMIDIGEIDYEGRRNLRCQKTRAGGVVLIPVDDHDLMSGHGTSPNVDYSSRNLRWFQGGRRPHQRVVGDACPDSERPDHFKCCWNDGRYVKEFTSWIWGDLVYECRAGREEQIACARNGVQTETYDDHSYRYTCERDHQGYRFRVSHCIDDKRVAHAEGENFTMAYSDKMWFSCEKGPGRELIKVAKGCIATNGAFVDAGGSDYDGKVSYICREVQRGQFVLEVERDWENPNYNSRPFNVDYKPRPFHHSSGPYKSYETRTPPRNLAEEACPDSERPDHFRCCWNDGRYVKEFTSWIWGDKVFECRAGREETIGCARNGVKTETYDERNYRYTCEKDHNGYRFRVSHCIDSNGVVHEEDGKFKEPYNDKIWFACARGYNRELSKVPKGCIVSNGAFIGVGDTDYDGKVSYVCRELRKGVFSLEVEKEWGQPETNPRHRRPFYAHRTDYHRPSVPRRRYSEDDCPDSDRPDHFSCCWSNGKYVREFATWVWGDLVFECKAGEEEKVGCARNGVAVDSYDDNGYRLTCMKNNDTFEFNATHCLDKGRLPHPEDEKFIDAYGDLVWYLCNRTEFGDLKKVVSGCVTIHGKMVEVGEKDYDGRVCQEPHPGVFKMMSEEPTEYPSRREYSSRHHIYRSDLDNDNVSGKWVWDESIRKWVSSSHHSSDVSPNGKWRWTGEKWVKNDDHSEHVHLHSSS